MMNLYIFIGFQNDHLMSQCSVAGGAFHLHFLPQSFSLLQDDLIPNGRAVTEGCQEGPDSIFPPPCKIKISLIYIIKLLIICLGFVHDLP